LIDTGSSCTLLSPEAAEKVGLKNFKGPSVEQLDPVGILRAGQLTQTKKINIGGAWTINEIIATSKLPKAAGDGILGLSTLADWDLRFDPLKKKLTIFPEGKAPAIDGEEIIEITNKRLATNPLGYDLISIHMPMIVGTSKVLAMVDTGYSGTVDLPEAWVRANEPDIMQGLPSARINATNVSGSAEGWKIKLPTFQFGSDHLSDFPANVTSDKDSNSFQLIGSKLLRHYVMTISFSKNELRLKSLGTVQSLTKASKRLSAGISFGFAEDGGMFILSLDPEGVAAQAGLKAGDEVLEMGGVVMKTIKPEQFKELKKMPTVKVRYRRGKEEPAEVNLVLEK